MKKTTVSVLFTTFLIYLAGAAEDTPRASDSAVPKESAAEADSAVLAPCVDLQEPSVEKAAADGKCRWTKKKLRIVFLDGTEKLRSHVMKAAKEWEEPSQLKLEFVVSGISDIRVSFAHRGHYSYIGNMAARIKSDQHTMNLQFTDRTPDDHIKMITLHEFGHAFGLIHEHQSPSAKIHWNEVEVMAYYQGEPNFWNKAKIRRNVLEKYEKTQTMRATEFDRSSIMLYPIDKRFTDGFSSDWNKQLSSGDRTFIREFYKDLFATELIENPADRDARVAASLLCHHGARHFRENLHEN